MKPASTGAAWCALAALACAVPAWSAGQEMPAAAAAESTSTAITDRDITLAVEKVRADPNLATERRIRMLKWVKAEEEKKKDLSWLKWLGELFGWFARNGRFLFWGVLAVLAALLVVYLWRLVRAYGLPERSRRVDVPSFVRDLDIRPESLPADIGAAARKLWDAGEHRSSLALLYRGLLSRLVHAYNVPIRDSSTEGDCLVLASKHLVGEERKIYVTSLVRVWQRAVYGGEDIPTESVYALCDDFARALDAPILHEPASGKPAAGMSA